MFLAFIVTKVGGVCNRYNIRMMGLSLCRKPILSTLKIPSESAERMMCIQTCSSFQANEFSGSFYFKNKNKGHSHLVWQPLEGFYISQSHPPLKGNQKIIRSVLRYCQENIAQELQFFHCCNIKATSLSIPIFDICCLLLNILICLRSKFSSRNALLVYEQLCAKHVLVQHVFHQPNFYRVFSPKWIGYVRQGF